MSSPDVSSGSVQNELDELNGILSKGEYTVYQAQAAGTSRFSLSEWILRQLKKLLPSVDMPAGAGKAFEYTLYVLLLAILVVAIVWLSRQFVRKGRIRSWAQLQEEAIGRSPETFLLQAQQLAAEGRRREAVRSGFLALLLGLERQGRLRVEGWKTNWDYADELRQGAASVEALFRDSSSLFERIWYGQEPVSVEQYERFYALVAELIESGKEGGYAQME